MKKFMVFIMDKNKLPKFILHANNTFYRLDSKSEEEKDLLNRLYAAYYFGLISNNKDSQNIFYEGENLNEVRKRVKEDLKKFKEDEFELTKEDIEFLNDKDTQVFIQQFDITFHKL